MFLGNVINLFIGLALTFGTVALAVSSITEGISSLLKQRADTLLNGLKEILNDPDLTGLAGEVLTHAATNPKVSISKLPVNLTKKDMPSYIPSGQFAAAMVDILAARGGGDDLLGGIEQLDAELRPLFGGMLSRALERGATDLDGFRDSLAKWFDNSMERISGDYKRWSQLVSLVIGVALAITLNVDSCAVATALWSDPQLTMNITQPAGDDLLKTVKNITDLKAAAFPFGWTASNTPVHAFGWGAKVLGWGLTATAALFGAPFWFDLLQRFVQLRGTGLVPAPVVPKEVIEPAAAASIVVPPMATARMLVADVLPDKRAQLAAAVQVARPPSIVGGVSWFKQSFKAELAAGLAGRSYSIDLLSALAVQETYEVWGNLYGRKKLEEILSLCVGDTIDALGGRKAFPTSKADLLKDANGDALFDVARKALESLAPYNAAYRTVAADPDKFCHAFGIFQYDLQHGQTQAGVAANPGFFLNRRWDDFSSCLALCISELDAARIRAYGSGKNVLTTEEMVYVAIAYNQGSVHVDRGFKQGFRDSSGLYYGELIDKYMKAASQVS